MVKLGPKYLNTIGSGLLLAALLSGCTSPHNEQQRYINVPVYGSPGHYAPDMGYGAPYAAQPSYAQYQAGHATYNQTGMRPAYAYHPAAYTPRQAPYAYQNSALPRPPRGRLNLNYETLSAFESPLATEIGDVTFLLRGRIDTPLDYSLDQGGRVENSAIGNYQISAETQLRNRWTVGAVYGGRYENISGANNDYTDEVAGYIGGSWGTVVGGNVSDLVFEDTRRRRGVGEVALAGDGALGGLSEWSGGYKGRFGPVEISGVIDEDSNYDVGITFQRPIGNKDYRFTARHNNGTYVAADGITELDTKAFTGVGEYVYGSTRFDVGGGYEQISNADRWFASAGMSTKTGPFSFSAEGHIGQIEGQDEVSAVVGARYDIARGLAATMAVDYQDMQININGVDYLNAKDTRLKMALIYGF